MLDVGVGGGRVGGSYTLLSSLDLDFSRRMEHHAYGSYIMFDGVT